MVELTKVRFTQVLSCVRMLHQSQSLPLVGAQYLRNIFKIIDLSFQYPVAFQYYRKKKGMIYSIVSSETPRRYPVLTKNCGIYTVKLHYQWRAVL